MECYQEFIPRKPLREYIECIWYIESSRCLVNKWHELLPDHSVELVLTDAFMTRRHLKPKTVFFHGQSHVACLKTSKQELFIHGAFRAFGVRIRPLGLALLGRQTNQYLNKSMQLSELFSSQELSSLESIKTEHNISAAVHHLQHLMLEIFSSKKKDVHFEPMLKAVKQVHAHKGAISVQSLSQSVACSSKTLNRYFKQTIGILPKNYCRLVRFRELLNVRTHCHYEKVNDIAENLGFYDNVHLNKELRAIVNESAKRFLNLETNAMLNIQNYMLSRTKNSPL